MFPGFEVIVKLPPTAYKFCFFPANLSNTSLTLTGMAVKTIVAVGTPLVYFIALTSGTGNVFSAAEVGMEYAIRTLTISAIK
jgi:hypothetical protein